MDSRDTDADAPKEPKPASTSLASDSGVDKTVRFGCGALLGGLLFIAAAELGEGLGLEAFLFFAAIGAIGCGVLGVVFGEPFFERIIKIVRWP